MLHFKHYWSINYLECRIHKYPVDSRQHVDHQGRHENDVPPVPDVDVLRQVLLVVHRQLGEESMSLFRLPK